MATASPDFDSPPTDAAATADGPPLVVLFTDVEGSTRLWEQQTAAMAEALARHDALARAAVAGWRGRLVKSTGDGVHATFEAAADALAAMLQLQRGLADAAAAGSLPLAVRCGVHAATAEARDNDIFGPEVNRAARIMAAAHGGQMLVSDAVAQALLAAAPLPDTVTLRDLGRVRLKDLARPERLWQVLAPPLRAEFPTLRALEATPHNLPQQLNRFIGRDAVRNTVHQLLTQHRLVTLLGTGGIGKSRLALQVAADRAAGQAGGDGTAGDADATGPHPDGVWFVELAPLDDPQRLPQAVASVLGVKEEPGRPLDEALRHFVASRRLLLVLDNCEHVLDAAAALAKALLQAGAGLTVLATSREPLRIAGEAACPVPPLGLPGTGVEAGAPASPDLLLQHDAVRLFVERARGAQPAFALTPANAAAVLDICQRLDGIALALELAAARLRALPVQALADRLRDSFALLATRDSTVAPRQRTLQALIDWSHDLLDGDERCLYRRLSVFAGGWTLEAAEAVCADAALPADAVPDLLAALAEKSLVGLLPGDDGTAQAGHRYRMLDTVRQHAAAQLTRQPDDATALRRRHAVAQLALAESAQRQLGGADKAQALAQLDTERDNLLAALAWCAQDGTAPGADAAAATRAAAERGLQLSFALRPYLVHRGLLSTALGSTRALLQHPGAQPRDSLRARGLFNAGQLLAFMGRHGEAMPPLLESLVIARETGDTAREAAVLQPLVMASMGLGDTDAARRHAADAVAAARQLGQPLQLASALNALAQLDRSDGRLDAAEAAYTEALALARRAGSPDHIAVLQLNLAMVALPAGRIAACRDAVAEAIAIVGVAGARPAAVGVLDVCTGLAMAAGDAPRAVRTHGLAEAQCQAAGLQRDAADAAFLAPSLQAARRVLGAGFEACLDDGRQADFDTLWNGLPAWLAGLDAPVSRSR